MFNATNHVNLGDPSTGLGMRAIQLDGRLRWLGTSGEPA
jgi:hypothetical protein